MPAILGVARFAVKHRRVIGRWLIHAAPYAALVVVGIWLGRRSLEGERARAREAAKDAVIARMSADDARRDALITGLVNAFHAINARTDRSAAQVDSALARWNGAPKVTDAPAPPRDASTDELWTALRQARRDGDDLAHACGEQRSDCAAAREAAGRAIDSLRAEVDDVRRQRDSVVRNPLPPMPAERARRFGGYVGPFFGTDRAMELRAVGEYRVLGPLSLVVEGARGLARGDSLRGAVAAVVRFSW